MEQSNAQQASSNLTDSLINAENRIESDRMELIRRVQEMKDKFYKDTGSIALIREEDIGIYVDLTAEV
jgi:hypothetical protein